MGNGHRPLSWSPDLKYENQSTISPAYPPTHSPPTGMTGNQTGG